jgi:hypothetical protein
MALNSLQNLFLFVEELMAVFQCRSPIFGGERPCRTVNRMLLEQREEVVEERPFRAAKKMFSEWALAPGHIRGSILPSPLGVIPTWLSSAITTPNRVKVFQPTHDILSARRSGTTTHDVLRALARRGGGRTAL